MLLFLIIGLKSFSQRYDLELIELQTKYNTLVIDNKLDIVKDIVGKTIISKIDGNELELNFINNQHLILSKNTCSFLVSNGTKGSYLLNYKICTINNIQLIVILVDSGSDNDLVGILVKEKNKDYKLYETFTDELYTFILSENIKINEEIFFEDEELKSLNYHDPKLEIFVKNNKFGILRTNKEILEPKSDSIRIYGKIITSYRDNKINLLSTNGQLLAENIRDYYPYSTNTYQILDSTNTMSFIDTLGIKTSKPINRRSLMGNDTDVKDTKIYTINKNNNISIKSVLSGQGLRKVITFEDLDYNDNLEKNILKFIKIPRKHSKLNFINNENKIVFESYWYYVAFYKPLPPNFFISKKRGKYGLWNFENDSIIIPFEYKNIRPNTSYLTLKKNGLYTFYPNIGTIPKYQKLDDYIEFYARFEFTNRKKGWVNRKGDEFFDEI